MHLFLINIIESKISKHLGFNYTLWLIYITFVVIVSEKWHCLYQRATYRASRRSTFSLYSLGTRWTLCGQKQVFWNNLKNRLTLYIPLLSSKQLKCLCLGPATLRLREGWRSLFIWSCKSSTDLLVHQDHPVDLQLQGAQPLPSDQVGLALLSHQVHHSGPVRKF